MATPARFSGRQRHRTIPQLGSSQTAANATPATARSYPLRPVAQKSPETTIDVAHTASAPAASATTTLAVSRAAPMAHIMNPELPGRNRDNPGGQPARTGITRMHVPPKARTIKP
jgi:hypothetical protein